MIEHDGMFLVDKSDPNYESQMQKLHDLAVSIADVQRKRLDAESPYPWWADVVFGIRDINSLVNVMLAQGDDDLAQMLSNIVAVTVERLLVRTIPDKLELERIANKLREDGMQLDAIMIREVMKQFNMEQGTEH